MSEVKKCIFHVPNHIDDRAASGSQIRPISMIKAFREIGYDVDVILGNGKKRKAQIKKIKKKIDMGEKYDFLYSESSTMPTLLTERHHLPTYPILDFGFMKFIKKHDISIGLFYRDIYWKFPVYKKDVPFIKRIFSIAMYRYDLKQYQKHVDILYLPSNKMKDYVGIRADCRELPPGCKCDEKESISIENTESLKLFYVGGVGELYDLKQLMIVVNKLPFVELTICCRENEWSSRKQYYQQYVDERIHIVHATGNELEKYYNQADVCMLYFESEGYRNFAMPIKLFEYLSHVKPIIATEGSAAGDFVKDNDIGWTIPFQEEALSHLLSNMWQEITVLHEKATKLYQVREQNTWKARASQVAKDLTKRREKNETNTIKED